MEFIDPPINQLSSMRRALLYFGFLLLFSLAIDSSIAAIPSEEWVVYYRTGGGEPSDIVWDLYQVDIASIYRHGTFLRYRVRIAYSDGKIGAPEQMQADCDERTHGQFPDPRMRSTYKGTLGGEEVAMVCRIAEQKKL